MDDLLTRLAQLEKNVQELTTERVGQQDIIPTSIKPRHLANSNTPNKGDTFYADANGNFSPLPIGAAGNLLWVSQGIPAWLTNGSNNQVLTMVNNVPAWATSTSATKPVVSSAVSGADFTTTSTTYVDSTATTSSVSITVAVTSNILIVVSGAAQDDTDTSAYTLGIGKGINTALITRTVDPAHASIGNVFTLTYMDLSIVAGTYVYHMGAASAAGKTTRIISGSIITAIAFPA